MEGSEKETPILGKLIARPTLPIQAGDRDAVSEFEETERRDGAVDAHQRDLGEGNSERVTGMADELRVQCLRDDAVLPVRGSSGAAGYDISAASECVIPAHDKGTVDTGLAVSLPPGTYARIAPRSGLAYRHFIDVGAGVVDSDYRGEIKVILFNHSAEDFPVQAGDRIAQLILERIDTPPVRKVAVLEDTDRGSGGFGSTGTHSFSQSSQKNEKGKKKKNSSPSKSRSQQRQAQGSVSVVERVEPGSSNLNQVIRGPIRVEEIVFSDRDLEKATIWVGDSLQDVESSSRTRQWRRTLELAAKVGTRSMRILVDSGSTGNYIDARECTTRKLQIQKEEAAEELRLADGSTVKTEGRVRVHVKCGEYRGTVYARVFPQMNKQMILGIPWLSKENPHIDWAQGAITVRHGQRWISLPLAKPLKRTDEDEEAHLDYLISKNSLGSMMNSKMMTGAFLGYIREAEVEESVVLQAQGDAVEKPKWDQALPADVRAVLVEFDDVFPQELPQGLPPVRQGHEFKIDLEDDQPPANRPLYKMSPLELGEAKRQIQDMLEHGFIRPSSSPYGAPVLFVPKKDGSLRFCIDYRWLNRKTVKNRYPLPLPEELFDRLGSAKVFTKIDLRSGYWQMPVKPEDVHKTAFKTRWGLYECLVMPFGVTNAPAQFMYMMNDLLGEYLDDFVIVFLDDVLIYSANPQDHVEHLRKVLGKLRHHQLFAKASKCDILKTSVEFLGQQIYAGGMTPTEAKLKAVRDWSVPQNIKDIRPFLGFANYYRRFVRNFAEIADPLTSLTRKDAVWQWGPFQRRAFQQLKDMLCAAPVLQFPDPKLPYTVVTDASGTAAGGVLMQDQGDGLRPLAFLSRRLKPTEQRYSAYERELAAVAYCLMSWRHYLEGCPGGVTVVTDHQPLVRLMDQQVLSRAQTRWIRLGLFQSIRPIIKYQPGKANIVADALSRSQRSDAQELLPIPAMAKEAEAQDQLFVLSGTGLQLPEEMQRKWTTAYQEDRSHKTAFNQLRQGKAVDKFYLTPTGLMAMMVGKQQKIIVPQSLRQAVLKECHDVPSVGHVGMRRTLELVDRQFHWRGLRSDTISYVKTCPVCQVMKSDSRAKAGLLQPLEIPTRKWAHVTTDLVTDLPESGGFTAVAVFVDKLTKMVHFAGTNKEVTAMEYARIFVDTVFRLHGLPEVIISDRDPRFTGKFWRALFDLLGTDLRFSTAFHPQTDGQSERMIQTLENFLRPYVKAHPQTWSQSLMLAEFAANNAVNVATGYSPFYLNTGDHPLVPSALMHGGGVSSGVEAVQTMVDRMKTALEEAQANLSVAQTRAQAYVNKSRREETYEVGDEVVLTTRHIPVSQHLPAKLRRRWVGPFKIAKVISPVAYGLDLPPAWRVHPVFHVSNLKRFKRSKEFEREDQPPPPVMVEGEEEYEVEAILRHKGKGARRLYLVMWKGYPITEASWEPESHLHNAPLILEDYLRRVGKADQRRRRNRGGRGSS